jgi:hypothetical protein
MKILPADGSMTCYNSWPAGFSKNGSPAFVGAAYDGEAIWMVPWFADQLVKISTSDGSMTAFNNWPDGFSKGSNAFYGGVFDGESDWMMVHLLCVLSLIGRLRTRKFFNLLFTTYVLSAAVPPTSSCLPLSSTEG